MRGRTSVRMLIPISLGAALLAGCSEHAPAVGGDTRTSIVAAGDVASCFWRADEMTARLLDRTGGIVAMLGDAVYQRGTPNEFARCYAPTWGRHLERTRPAVGNHEYETPNAAGYWAYFGERAGEAGKGWYSYDVDDWHVVVLNTNREADMAEQLAWLREDLRENPSQCTLAYMHHPRFSSGKRPTNDRVKPVWDALYAAGVEVILAGHEHHYERFAPQTPDGRPDPARGIRQFIVGTGGAPAYRVRGTAANSEVRNDRVRGVLRLIFHDDGYEWRFVPVRGQRFRDEGRGTCH
jgi:acid phosphatase type 7